MELPTVNWFDNEASLPPAFGWLVLPLGVFTSLFALLTLATPDFSAVSLTQSATFFLWMSLRTLGAAYTTNRRLDVVNGVMDALLGLGLLTYLVALDGPITLAVVGFYGPVAVLVFGLLLSSFVFLTGVYRTDVRRWNRIVSVVAYVSVGGFGLFLAAVVALIVVDLL